MSFHTKYLGVLLICLMLIITGCFVSPSSDSISQASTLQETTQASAPVGKILLDMADVDNFKYGQEEVATIRVLNSLFKELLKLSPDNLEANFVASITGVIVKIESDGIADALNEILHIPSPFDPLFIDRILDGQLDALTHMGSFVRFSTFKQLQNTIADSVLPALDFAIEHLPLVAAAQNFSMEIPQSGTKMTVGSAEATLLLGSFKVMRGLLTLCLAYNFEYDKDGSYDYLDDLRMIAKVRNWQLLSTEEKAAMAHLRSLLDNTSPLLSVRQEWVPLLARVDSDITEALPMLSKGLSMIRDGKGQGNNPLIRIGDITSSGMSPTVKTADLDKAISIIDSLNNVCTFPRTVYVPFSDTPVEIDIKALFGGISNFRIFMPCYGLYPVEQLSMSNPLVYFTDESGVQTATIADVIAVINRGRTGETTIQNVIQELQQLIIFKDVTFGGLFPKMTKELFWNRIGLALAKDMPVDDAWDTMEHLMLSLLGPNGSFAVISFLKQ